MLKMADSEDVDKMRPNIRIEIANNLVDDEKMDVDGESVLDENEEGEIFDDNEPASTLDNDNTVSESRNQQSAHVKGIFTTGIDIFDKHEQEKLQERAKRFALKPEEIHTFTDADLEELYESLGITSTNENNVRFDTVHLLGTSEMSVEDILDYLAKYAPTTIEWVDKDSCNVTWFENVAAARAMFYISKAVNGMPAREPVNTFAKEFLDEEPEEPTGQSVLLRNKLPVVEIRELLPNKLNLKNAADISEITIPIPPGYWRLGEKHEKAKCLLLRYALKTDKKPYRVEPFSKYYKSLGIISDKRKRDIRGIFERNREILQDKNPWGSLARNWDQDAQFREPEPDCVTPKIEIKNPRLLVRLGKKKVAESVEDAVDVIADEITEKKSKPIPRMRMYADEEEEKLRRKKLLQTLKSHTEKLSKENNPRTKDLRNVLSLHNVNNLKEEVIDVDAEVPDLGSKLKNRTKQMIYTVKRDIDDGDDEIHGKRDIRNVINERRRRSPDHHRIHRTLDRRRSPIRRRFASPTRRRSPYLSRRSPQHRRSSERTLHSDRMPSRGDRHSDYARGEMYSDKPRSKVAVVIKTPKAPTVASTIWSRVKRHSESEESSSGESDYSSKSEESSSSEESDSQSDSESEEDSSDTDSGGRRPRRPGFRGDAKVVHKVNTRSPLKITMRNDRFRK